jgi:hypothetical protein
MAAKPKGLVFTPDTRLPGSDLPRSNPAHPDTLMRSVLEASAQTTADTKYDITPPAREKAGFTNPPLLPLLPLLSLQQKHIPNLLILVACGALFAFLLLKQNPLPVRILLSIVLILALHHLATQVSTTPAAVAAAAAL